MSVAPPAGKGTIQRIGRSGHEAPIAALDAVIISKPAKMDLMRIDMAFALSGNVVAHATVSLTDCKTLFSVVEFQLYRYDMDWYVRKNPKMVP